MSEAIYTTEYGRFKSSQEGRKIHYEIFTREDLNEPKGIIQISHGMCDYTARYAELAHYLNDLGFVVCGNDHLGHGCTALLNDCDCNDPSKPSMSVELGWIAPEKGWTKCVKDLHRLTVIMKKKYPGVPYFMLGHSMGSFFARAYAAKYGDELEGVVFMGTSAGISIDMHLLNYLDVLELTMGDRYRLDLTSKLFFGEHGIYNRGIENKINGYDWVSRDEEVVKAFAEDPLCNYTFTVNGYKNMIEALAFVNNDKWFESYPKDLPTYLVSGSKDPIGDHGKGVLKVYNRMRLFDCNVELKLYKGARHELFSEINKAEVFEDLGEFFLENCTKKCIEDNSTENCTEGE